MSTVRLSLQALLKSGKSPRRFLSFAGLALIAALLSGCSTQRSGSAGETDGTAYRRIISFAPSITETLFSLGFGERVIGVTRYCLYPPEAKRLPKVGGYIDPNFEMLLGLKPDLVLMLKEHGPLLGFLEKNKIRYAVVENHRLDDILSSFSAIASLCGAKERGDSMASAVEREIRDSAGHDTSRLRVLFCAGRDNPGGGNICKMYAAGSKTFYHELILAAGAENGCTDSLFVYPELSAEGIVRMQPEVIIDIMPSMSSLGSKEKAVADWNSMPLVPAVRSRCVYCLTADYATIPGPRIALLLRDMRNILADAKKRIGQRKGYAPAAAGATGKSYAAH